MSELSPALHVVLEPLTDLAPHVFAARLPDALEQLPSPEWLVALLSPAAATPLQTDDRVRAAVRDVLRHGGYKPTGRGKPASEYLVRAAQEGGLRSINLAVDACNAVSLHSGLPISVVDAAQLRQPLRIALGGEGASYVFNASGQVIDVSGLPCLCDAAGPCANAVKDAQRTKTSGGTRDLLIVIWGCRQLAAQGQAALAFYRELLERAGATLFAVELEASAAG
jgi:DNA/RNA-binding domain of Phe-tRNA-synthetase-like protein